MNAVENFQICPVFPLDQSTKQWFRQVNCDLISADNLEKITESTVFVYDSPDRHILHLTSHYRDLLNIDTLLESFSILSRYAPTHRCIALWRLIGLDSTSFKLWLAGHNQQITINHSPPQPLASLSLLINLLFDSHHEILEAYICAETHSEKFNGAPDLDFRTRIASFDTNLAIQQLVSSVHSQLGFFPPAREQFARDESLDKEYLQQVSKELYHLSLVNQRYNAYVNTLLRICNRQQFLLNSPKSSSI